MKQDYREENAMTVPTWRRIEEVVAQSERWMAELRASFGDRCAGVLRT